MIIKMESLFDIIEYLPTSPIVFPEWPETSLGCYHKCGFWMYSLEECKDVAGVKKDWYSRAEYISIRWMHDGVDDYVSNPSADYDIGKIIFAGKERSSKIITKAKKAWINDLSYQLQKTNQPSEIDQNFIKDLNKKNIRVFVWKVLSKKVS